MAEVERLAVEGVTEVTLLGQNVNSYGRDLQLSARQAGDIGAKLRPLFGDLHAYGPDSFRFYTKRKTITQRWPSAGVREGIQYTFPSNN